MIKAAAVVLCGLAIALLFLLPSCNLSGDNSGIPADSTSIRAGEQAFNEKCAGCHNFNGDGIGPHLAGVTEEREIAWLKRFIRDPKQLMDSGDSVAKKLLAEFRTQMPSFKMLSDAELNSLLAYMHTYKKTELHLADDKDTGYLVNPIPDTIPVSDITVAIEPFAQIPFSSNQPPLTRIVKMDYMPVSHQLFIVDLRGKLYRMSKGLVQPYMDMQKLRPRFIHQPGLATGFGSFAFHPEFNTNGLLYTTHTEKPGAANADFGYHDSIPVLLQWVLTEWKVDNPSAATFSGKGREMMRVNMPSQIHGVQEITFNKFAKPGSKDYGLLYIGIGDGGSVEIRQSFVSDKPSTIWGSIIRIDPARRDGRNKQYGIPADNPFARSKNAEPEIYAWGFRNPHKINWSRAGQMFTVNVGELNLEALYLVEPGRFYGWPIREGTFVIEFAKNKRKVYPPSTHDTLQNITYPVAEFDHDEGTAICVGYEYQGEAIESLKGKYVFGDMGSGKLFYVNMKDIRQGQLAPIKRWNLSLNGQRTTLLDLCKTSRVDMRYGMDAQGELYIFTKQDGKVYRLLK
jgi:glucose/arabinose dehydrogenase/mono/diheme cytochrome c family protein